MDPEQIVSSALGAALWLPAALIGWLIPRLMPADLMDVIENHCIHYEEDGCA